MIANSCSEYETVAWEQLPVEEVFQHDGQFWAKITPRHMLRVTPTADGSWIGGGKAIRYEPSWQFKFTIARKTRPQRITVLHRAPARPLRLLAVICVGLLVVGLFSLLLWLLT